MGRRDDDELTDLSTFEADDAALRRMLSALDQPAPSLPPQLVARTLAALPPTPPGKPSQPRSGRRVGASLAAAVVAITMMVALFAQTTPTNLTPPVPIIGAANSSGIQATLTLSLATKPLLNLLSGWGWMAALLCALLLLAVMCWAVVRMTPPEDLLERRA